MDPLGVYLPQDRLRAVASGGTMPDRAHGSALFADISGFTPLTEGLTRQLGPRRGAEELTRQLNRVYDAVIEEVNRFHGSVIGFSGDAITCWFEGDDGLRAIATALAMQEAMKAFAVVELPGGISASLAMKTGIATGPARRFVVGDPQIQLMDVLAGQTLALVTAAEHMSGKGDVVVDGDTAERLGTALEVAEWRTEAGTGHRFAAIRRLAASESPAPAPTAVTAPLPAEKLRCWLVPAVYERLQSGQGEFLTELRPAAVLFLKFDGIDYDRDDEAGVKLDAYIRWVQAVLARYGGTLLQLIIGDKGSFLYAAFGTPIAYENDARRAATACIELRAPPAELAFINRIKLGFSRGTMRTGAYGATTRRTYGIMGDEVNLACRLMENSPPGHILVSQDARVAAGDSFAWKQQPDLKVKGKAQPVAVCELLGPAEVSKLRRMEPRYALPMVGREAELALIRQKLQLAAGGQGQVIGVTAVAGMGKSRLVAEAVRLADEQQFTGFAGECQSYGTNTSYLVWWDVWRGFFNVEAATPIEDTVRSLEAQLTQLNPGLAPRLPLLASALNLPIPDNDLTRAFDAKLRKSSLEALLVDCLRGRAQAGPLILILEDCHWLDSLSRDLLDVLARTITQLPVVLFLAYRPPEVGLYVAPPVTHLRYFTEVKLAEFTPKEAELLVERKLAHLFGTQNAAPRALVERFLARAQGNPFYLEELLNYLRDRNISPTDAAAIEHLDLPTSLQSLILSRIDQLTERQKVTLKVASVVGRLFRASMLWGVYPQLGDSSQVQLDLKALNRLDVTMEEDAEPELSYMFKHIVTQEVAYHSLPHAMRTILHDQIGQHLERTHAQDLNQCLNLLAFHYDRSPNEAKKREYLLKAGEAAQREYANTAAQDYYQRVLPILPSAEQIGVMLKLGQVLELVGQWTEAAALYERALAVSTELGDRNAEARCQAATGDLCRKQGRYGDASLWLNRAQAIFEQTGNQEGLAQALHANGNVSAQNGDYPTARRRYEHSLALRRQLGDNARVASLLNNLGILAVYRNEHAAGRALYEESLALRRELRDRWAIGNSLNNLGVLLRHQHDFTTARTMLEESLGLNRQVGDRWAIANTLTSLGEVALDQRDFAAARGFIQESLLINRDLGERRAIAFLLESFAGLAAAQDKPARALRLAGTAAALRAAIGAPLSPSEQERLDKSLATASAKLSDEARSVATNEGRATPLEQAIQFALAEDDA